MTESLAQHSTALANYSPMLQAITAVQCSPLRCLLQWSWRIHKQAANQSEQHLTLRCLRSNASMRFVAPREAGHSLPGLATSCEQCPVAISQDVDHVQDTSYVCALRVVLQLCLRSERECSMPQFAMQWLLRRARNLKKAASYSTAHKSRSARVPLLRNASL